MKNSVNITFITFLLVLLGHNSICHSTTIRKDSVIIKQERYNGKTIVWENLSMENGGCTYVTEWGQLEKTQMQATYL